MHRYLRRTLSKLLPAFLLLAVMFSEGIFSKKSFSQNPPDGAVLFQPCAACHQIGKGRLVGPDLYQISQRLDREWLIRFIRNSQEVIQSGDEYAVKLFEEYNKIPMPPAGITDEEIIAVLDYIDNYDPEQAAAAQIAASTTETEESASTDGFFKETKDHNRQYLTTFIITLILMFAAIFDLFVTKLIKARFVHAIVILISLFVVVEITVVEAQNLGRQPGYEPDQPILFSHKVHAGDNKIDCQYCHTSVNESKHAGIPSVAVCMNCHNVVREGRYSGTEEIAKIYKAVESGKPIEWVRVHNLPDHTYFNHAQHVNAGKMECESCHGDVKSMDRIKQVQQLSMGWCIECHRVTEVQFTENKFYEKFTRLHEELESGAINRVTVEDVGGTECAKCHY